MKAQLALEYLLAKYDWLLGSGSFGQAVEVFSGLFSITFSRFCCTVLMITRWKVDYRNIGSKQWAPGSKHRLDEKTWSNKSKQNKKE